MRQYQRGTTVRPARSEATHCSTRRTPKSACPASPVHYQFNPVKTVKSNVLGSLHVLGLAKRVSARVLQASRAASMRGSSSFDSGIIFFQFFSKNLPGPEYAGFDSAKRQVKC